MRASIALSVIVLFFLGCSQGEQPVTEISTSGESALHVTNSDELIISWIEEIDGLTNLKFARTKGESFADTTIISSGDNWFVNWADFPAIVSNGDVWFAHYLQKSDSATFAYDVMFKLSHDSGKSWSEARKLHSDTTRTEHGFVSVIPFDTGFYAVWLDGRNTGGSGEGDHSGHHGAMSLRGAYIDSSGAIESDVELDRKTCDCCQTHITVVDGRPTAVYRDRSDEEIRDIYLTQLQDTSWSEPVAVYPDNWKIAGCPVNGPRILSSNETTVIAWFTGATDEGTIKVSFSGNQGLDFSEVLELETDGALGRIDLLSGDDEVLVSWIGQEQDGYALKLARLSWDGTLKETKTLTTLDGSRRTGFPRIAFFNNRLYATYTETASQKVQVRSYEL